MGYVANPSLTDLGVLRPEGSAEDQQDEGLGLSRAGRRRLSRGGRAFGRGAAIRRSRALRSQAASRRSSTARRLDPSAPIMQRRGLIGGLARRASIRSRAVGAGVPGGTTFARRPRRGRRARQRARAARQRGAPGTPRPGGRFAVTRGIFGRMRRRRQAAAAERAAAEALAIAEAERLARETVTGPTPPPTVTDRGGWGRPRVPPPRVGTMQACVGPPPDRRRGWVCFSGQWRYQMPGGGFGPQPVQPERPPQNGAPWPPPGTEIPKVPTTRPWWMGRAPDGEIPLRDTSGIPTPPGLPGGPSMRPPASGPEDTATERVPSEAPAAAGLDVAKLLPIAAAAAFMFMRK